MIDFGAVVFVLMFVGVGVVALLSYSNVATLQRIIRDKEDEITNLSVMNEDYQRLVNNQTEEIRKLEIEKLMLDQICDIFEEDLLLLGEAVDVYLETGALDDLEAVHQVMCYLEDKYAEDEQEGTTDEGDDNEEDELDPSEIVKRDPSVKDVILENSEYQQHTSCFECDKDCSFCDEATNKTVH